MMLGAALAAALLAQASAPCPVTLPSGTAVRGGFEPSDALPDFTIHNREKSHVLVRLEPVGGGEDHVFYILSGDDVTLRGVPLDSYNVSVAVGGRLGPDCRTLAAAISLYRFEQPFVFTRTETVSPGGVRNVQMEGHWIELGNGDLRDADADPITVAAFNRAAPARAKTPAAATPVPWIPADFAVPTLIEGPGFKLAPLGPALTEIDYRAYMGSIAHLQATFTRSPDWPNDRITLKDAAVDMETEAGRFARRESFAYAVLTPDGTRERGCVYVYPSRVAGHDAQVVMWVTAAEYEAGFDAELYAWTLEWIARDWPFANVAYPGRSIAWEKWDAMVAAGKS